MKDFVLQPWNLFKLTGTANRVQSAEGYVDLADFDDIVIYTDIRERAGSLTIWFQTAATDDNPAFQNLISVPGTAASSPYVTPVHSAYSGLPLLRYLRWNLVPTATTDITFRVHVAAFGPGR